jgi:hypothetical protein
MLTEKDFIQDSCKSTPGFEYYAKRNKKIDLEKLKVILDKTKIYVSKDNSPFYIHVKTDIGEATIFASLKIMIKDLMDEEQANKLFNQILKQINKIL